MTTNEPKVEIKFYPLPESLVFSGASFFNNTINPYHHLKFNFLLFVYNTYYSLPL